MHIFDSRDCLQFNDNFVINHDVKDVPTNGNCTVINLNWNLASMLNLLLI